MSRVKLSNNPPADGKLRVIQITWNMGNQPPTQEDVKKILDSYPRGTEVDVIVIACQEEKRDLEHRLATKLTSEAGFTGQLTAKNHHLHETVTAGSRGQISLTVMTNLPGATVVFDEYWDEKVKKFGFVNKGGITANVSVPGCTPFNVANFHLESKEDSRKSAELMELWRKANRVDGKRKTYDDLTQIAGPTYLLGDGNWRNIEIRGRGASLGIQSPYDSRGLNPARMLTLCGGTGPTHDNLTYSGSNGKAVTKAAENAKVVDKSRAVGKTGFQYVKTGILDFISQVGNKLFTNSSKVITDVSTKGIDHAPVTISTTLDKETKFDRTKTFVVNAIVGLKEILPEHLKAAYATFLEMVEKLEENDDNKKLLTGIFNQFTAILSNHAMPSEVARMSGDTLTYTTEKQKAIALANTAIHEYVVIVGQAMTIVNLQAELKIAEKAQAELPEIEAIDFDMDGDVDDRDVALEGSPTSTVPADLNASLSTQAATASPPTPSSEAELLAKQGLVFSVSETARPASKVEKIEGLDADEHSTLGSKYRA